MTPESGQAGRVREEQLKLLYGSLSISSFATVVVAVTTAFVLRGHASANVIQSWLLLVAVITVARLVTAATFHHNRSIHADGDVWHLIYWIGAALAGFSWGLGALLLFPEHPAVQAFLGFVIAGISSGAVSTMGASLRSLATFLALAVTPLSLAFLSVGNSTATAMGFLSFFYLAAGLSSGKNNYKMIVAALKTRIDRDDTEREMKRVARTATHGFWTWPDTSLGEQWWSERMYALLGYTKDDIEPSYGTWQRLVHPDDASRVLADLEGGRSLIRPFDIEFRVLHRSGEYIWIRNRIASEDHADGTVSLSGTVSDITNLMEEKEARAATLHELETYKNALDQHAIVAVTDRAGRIQYVNEKFVEISKYSRKELIGKTHKVVNGGYHPRQFWKNVWETISAGKVWSGDVCNTSKDGDEYWLASTIVPLTDETGAITNFIAVRTDITGRKEQEFALTELMVEAEAGRTAQANFLSTMSHEIRTPLNGILGMAGLLVDTTLDDEQNDYATTIVHSGESLLSIINQILDFSKIEAGKLELDPYPFDLESTIAEAIDLMLPTAREKGLRFRFRYDPGTPTSVCGDPNRFRQILLNLVGNALKFTAEGHVMVEVEQIEASDSNVLVRTSIHDTGIGVSEEQARNLFEPFRQADQSTSRKFGGTGLGLAVCKQLAQLMGGETGVTSEPGHGSTFWFTVRFERNSTSRESPRQPILRGSRVLVASQDATDAALLTELLQDQEGRPETVPCAEDALWLLREKNGTDPSFDIVIVDHCPPVIDGMALGPAIKSDSTIGDAKLVLLTAPGEKYDQNDLVQAGFEAHLVKPVIPSTLRKTLAVMRDQTKRSARFITRHNVAQYSVEPADGIGDADSVDQRILLVEDNKVNQKVAVAIFRRMGCKIDVANDGQEAVEMVGNTHYDQIYMDCQMPVMDGFEATRRMRLLEQMTGDHTPIIAMTANAMEGDRDQCLRSGMDDFIAKPVRAVELEAMVRTVGRSVGR